MDSRRVPESGFCRISKSTRMLNGQVTYSKPQGKGRGDYHPHSKIEKIFNVMYAGMLHGREGEALVDYVYRNTDFTKTEIRFALRNRLAVKGKKSSAKKKRVATTKQKERLR